MAKQFHTRSNNLSLRAVFWIRFWLLVLGVLVYGMILVGGATRLTDSGLSITDWRPISGIFPPMSLERWAYLFDLYRETAEYQLQNRGMSMAEFQYIYWWEWGHRVMGRVIGIVAILGYVIFAACHWLKRGLAWKLAFLILLGGLQGVIGYWMVASGIGDTDRVDVAPYRLMVHFTLALIIIAYIYWLWLGLTTRPIRLRSTGPVFGLFAALIFLQMASGALVAGLDAGRTYTDWPLMAGDIVPPSYWVAELGWRNPFENAATAQFNHRILAYLIAIFAALLILRNYMNLGRYGLKTVGFLVTAQVIWGIVTVMQAAPLGLALVHQGLGVLLMLASIRSVWKASRITS